MFQRSTLIGSPVLIRGSGKKLGRINQIWCISGLQKVVVLGVRKMQYLGAQRYVKLKNIECSAAAVWVDPEEVVGQLEVYTHTTYLRTEIITEAGVCLGRVCDFWFDMVSGAICSWEISPTGLPFIPEPLASIQEFSADELVNSSYKRLIVREGAENRLNPTTFKVREHYC